MTNNPTLQELSPEARAEDFWFGGKGVELLFEGNHAIATPVGITLTSLLANLIREAEQRGAESMREMAAQVAEAVFGCPEGCGDYISKRILRLTTTEAHSAMADSPEYPTAEVAEAHARATQAKIDKALEWYQETIIGDSPSKGETD